VIWSEFLFIRYQAVGSLPVTTTIQSVRSGLIRKEASARFPTLSLSLLVLAICVIGMIISFPPRQTSTAFTYVPEVKVASNPLDTTPLDVGLSPTDRLSASNSLAPVVEPYRWRVHARRRFHSAHAGWSGPNLSSDDESGAQALALSASDTGGEEAQEASSAGTSAD